MKFKSLQNKINFNKENLMKKILLSILVTLGLNSMGIAQQDEKGSFFTDDMEIGVLELESVWSKKA